VDPRALAPDHDEPAAVAPRPLVGAHELAPTPISLKSRELSVATIENTPIITAAALVTVARIPGDTASSVISRRSRPSRRPHPA